MRLTVKSVSFEDSLLFSRMQVEVIHGEGLEGTKLTSFKQDIVSSPAWRPLYLDCDIGSAFRPLPEGLTTTRSVCVYHMHTGIFCIHTHTLHMDTHICTHTYSWLVPIVNLINRGWPGRAASGHTREGLSQPRSSRGKPMLKTRAQTFK